MSSCTYRSNRGCNSNLDRILVGEEMNDFEGVGDDADGQEFLAVVAALHHQAECNFQLSLKEINPIAISYLSTNRSTMGIWAFLNCFLA